MGKISGWADAVSSNVQSPTEYFQDSTGFAETEAVADAQEIVAESEDAAIVESEQWISCESLADDNDFDLSSSKTPEYTQPATPSESYGDKIIAEIKLLNLCVEKDGDDFFFDISDFERDGISLLLEYAASIEDIDFFPIIQALMEVKRRGVSGEDFPEGISPKRCKSPNFDSLFESVKGIMFEAE